MSPNRIEIGNVFCFVMAKSGNMSNSFVHWLCLTLAATARVALSSSAAGQPETPSWHKYVRSPSSDTVKPVSVIAEHTHGNVTNPQGLIDANNPTIFSRQSGEDAPSVVVDFGQNVVGILSIQFAGSTTDPDAQGLPGLKLAFSETKQFLTDRSDFTRSDNAAGAEKLTAGTDQIAVRHNPYTWQNQHGCEHENKVCADGLHGFRYVKIWLDALESDAPYTSSAGSVSIASLSLEWSAYLGTPDTFTGWFECSDENITQWWFDGVYTVDMGTDFFFHNETEPRGASSPTLEGKQVLFDGAKRDRDPYVGDLAVASLTSYLSHDFAESSKNVLEDLALHQREDGWIPPASINNYTLPLFDYPLWWVVCTVDLVMYTGDVAFAKTHWQAVKKVLDEYYPANTDTDTNLLDKKAELGYGDYAFLPRSGPITYYNALYAHALLYTAQLADALGQSKDASRWTARVKLVAESLMKHNFDEQQGVFYDGGPCSGDPAGTYCDVHAQDGNSIAVMAGLTNHTVSNRILNYWQESASHPYGNAFYDNDALGGGFSQRVYAFISYFEIAARLSTQGQAASALDEIRRLYGWMAAHDPKITMWEGIGENGSLYEDGFTSCSHGWSTGIVPAMSNSILGVKPVEPGFKKWKVCPVADGHDITWARGLVPTPHGGIKVSWLRAEEKSGTVFSMTIEAPAGTTGVVCVPTFGKSSRVRVDGRVISRNSGASLSNSSDEHSITVDLKGGAHTIKVTV